MFFNSSKETNKLRILINRLLSKEKLKNCGVCVPRPSALGPISSAIGPKVLQEQIHEYSILLIQDHTCSRLKNYTYSRYSRSYLERPSYGVQNKWKGFSSQ